MVLSLCAYIFVRVRHLLLPSSGISLLTLVGAESVSCHHNEILDIATLGGCATFTGVAELKCSSAVTIPHRRPLCFWAKSTLFKSLITRAILTSSGSIPVHRNPNSGAAPEGYKAGGNGHNSTNDFHQALFLETFRALDAGEAIGVFPEGTSYTQPRIVQVKEGAARAALEYVRWQRDHARSSTTTNGRKLLIVPVGIVHTDKSQYQSRVRAKLRAE